MQRSASEPALGHAHRNFDAIVVGAGIAGIYMLDRLKKLGLSAAALDAAPAVGGTWYWNRYPGARCDIECLDYSYSFDHELQQEWEWTERYAGQPEILRYLNHVVDRLDLRPHLLLGVRVETMCYDEAAARWTIETDKQGSITAQFCAMATGSLSVPKLIEVPGLDSFEGRWIHTSRWPHDPLDFSHDDVALIGTGSSGVQVLPALAREASSVTVFVRTPPYCLPAKELPFEPGEVAARKAVYPAHRVRARHSFTCISDELGTGELRSMFAVSEEERAQIFESAWARGGLLPLLLSFDDVITDLSANAVAAEFVRTKIRETVKDDDAAASLSMVDHPLAAKRPCLDVGFYDSFNRDNVRLVDLRRTPIERIIAHGIRTTEEDLSFDTIVLATGFDAITGALLSIDVRGIDGQSLRDKWASGPRAYLDLVAAGFPNLFMITGPGSPSVQSNMWCSIEQHVEWIADCIGFLREHAIASIDACADAEDEWCSHVQELARASIYEHADSYQIGANVPGKPRVFMAYVGGLGTYRTTCDAIARDGYSAFVLGDARTATSSRSKEQS